MNSGPKLTYILKGGLIVFLSGCYGFILRFWWLIVLVFMLCFLTGCEFKEIETESGVICVSGTYIFIPISLSCNWDEYNLRTAYGCGATLTVDDPELFEELEGENDGRE